MKYLLRFVPADRQNATGIWMSCETDDDDFICGEKERIAMDLEEKYGKPAICVEIKMDQ